MKKQKTTAKKKVPYLDYMCNIGERVQWTNYKGEKFEGKLINMDDESLATVELDDGSIVHYQC